MREVLDKIIGIDITWGIIIAFIISLIISLFYKGNARPEDFSVLVAGTSFLFGILIAFQINNAQSNLSKINEIIKSDEGNLLSLYEISLVFGKETQDKVREVLDKYLIAQIDYFLKDFKYSSISFTNLFRYVLSIVPTNEREATAYSASMSILSESSTNRKKVETFVQDQMLPTEWVIILVLLITELFFIFYFNSGSLLSIILSSLLATTAISLVLALRDLDGLRRKEDKWIWEPLANLFHSLELLPYYPLLKVKEKKAKILKGQRVRIAEYPDVYPDMTNKVVKEIAYGRE